MKQILAHAAASPQEAEELATRLRAAGVEVEVRDTGASNTVGINDPTRPAWELWVGEESQAAAQEVVKKALVEFEAQGKELATELESEAMANAPVADAPPADLPVQSPATRNARVAAALLFAGVLFAVGWHVRLRLVSDPLPLGLRTYLELTIDSIVAVALWRGTGGARLVATLWVVLTGLYSGFTTLDVAPLVPLHQFAQMFVMLLLLLGSDSSARRWAAVGLWAARMVTTVFPLELVPARLTQDALVGLWKHPHSQELVAFCGDGRYFIGDPVFSSDGKWERVRLHELLLKTGTKTERHSYFVSPEHLRLFKQGWERLGGESPCDAPPK